MNITASELSPRPRSRAIQTVIIVLAFALFCLLFLLLDQAYYRFIAARFPDASASALTATLFGLISRAHVIVPLLLLVLWQPHLLGFTWGQTRRHWRWLLVVLLINCGVVAGYLWLTSSSTPYSGNQGFVTEVLTVPVVEETMWRGVVLTTLLLLFRPLYAGNTAKHLAVWFSGLAFGLLHAGNALAGVPVAFVAVQVLNAAVWGVVYGYVRTRTESLYPPILLHAAMNLVVVLA
jgi:membrane protease YdiL (CAAX protease family)